MNFEKNAPKEPGTPDLGDSENAQEQISSEDVADINQKINKLKARLLELYDSQNERDYSPLSERQIQDLEGIWYPLFEGFRNINDELRKRQIDHLRRQIEKLKQG